MPSPSSRRLATYAASPCSRSGSRPRRTTGLALTALVAARQGNTDLAGRLWGALEAEERRGFPGIWERERKRLGPEILALAGPAFKRGRTAGLALEVSEAVDIVLAASAAPV